MKIYRLCEPIFVGGFACALTPGGLGVHLGQAGTPPNMLVIEWLPGSNRVADFTWVIPRVVVTERVRNVFARSVAGGSFFDVQMQQDPRLKRPSRATQRTKPRVWLPYEGPPLHELWITTWINADLERSTLEVGDHAGRQTYHLKGAEEIESRWDQETGKMHWWREPRTPGAGLFVRHEDINDVQLFRVPEQPGMQLCTEAVKNLVEEYEFTNVVFLEVGEAV